jgi:hypothetical protein
MHAPSRGSQRKRESELRQSKEWLDDEAMVPISFINPKL